MDHFGIGQAMQSMAQLYFTTARRTGRSTSLLDSLKDGDRVVFTNTAEANRFQVRCRERNLKVECVVVPVNERERLFELGTSKGRTLFEHTWVEQHYLNALTNCQNELDHLQRESSGFGEAHFQTQRLAAQTLREPGAGS